jgi:hypothetical protein
VAKLDSRKSVMRLVWQIWSIGGLWWDDVVGWSTDGYRRDGV